MARRLRKKSETNNLFIPQPLPIRVRCNLDLFIFDYRALLAYRSFFPIIIEVVVFLYHFSTQHDDYNLLFVKRTNPLISSHVFLSQSAFFELLQDVFTHVANSHVNLLEQNCLM